MGMEHPQFLNPRFTAHYPEAFASEDDQFRYSAYAYIAWNICEAIFDRSHKNPQLLETWLPVIDAENRLHRVWFDRAENQHKFKQAFRDFVHTQFPPSETTI